MAPGFVRVAGCPRRAGALGLLLVLAGGCVVGSREPLYERSRDAAFDPWLVGTWRGRDGSVTISRGTGRSYVVVAADAEDGAAAEAVYYDLVPLGRRRYLFPQAGDSGLGTVLFQCQQVRRRGGQLHLRGLDAMALAERLRREQAGLAYETVDFRTGVRATRRAATATRPAAEKVVFQNVVLTAPPRQIRQYLVDHRDDVELFPVEVVLKKVAR